MEEEKNEPDFKCDIVDCLMEYVDKCQECISKDRGEKFYCDKHLKCCAFCLGGVNSGSASSSKLVDLTQGKFKYFILK